MSLYQVQEVTPTAEEITSGKPSAETIGEAVSIFQRDGIVILKQVVHSDALSRLNDVLLQDTERLCADPTTHFNQDPKARNISQGPPTDPELMFDTVWANPFTAAVSAAILGPRPCLHYVGGNAVLQTTERQTVHADLDEKHLRFPFAVVANIYLVDTGPENGSTEIWVGSHRDTDMNDHVSSPNHPGGLSSIKPELVEERRKFAPPVQPRIQKGDLVLRDVRLWHAGMPNRSETPRIMLAFSIFPWWYQPDLKLSLPESARPLVERWEKESELQFAVRWRLDGDPVPRFYATCRSTNAALVY